jgi:manganese-dependent inorganic pyrophosphatase
MFAAASNLKGKSDQDIFYQDFKRFSVGKKLFCIGQITSLDADELDALKPRMLSYAETAKAYHKVDMMFFMLTNILTESTDLICIGTGAEQLVQAAFRLNEKASEIRDGIVKLPGVVSRKKQLAPVIMMALQQ